MKQIYLLTLLAGILGLYSCSYGLASLYGMKKYIKDHPEFNTSFIKINCDYQKDWGYKKRDLKLN